MGARLTSHDAGDEATVRERFADEGLQPHSWSNGPGDRYGWHSHPYDKLLYCVTGSIVFTTRHEGAHELGPGDRLEIDAHTDHAATVGSDGVVCMEAAR